VDVIVDRILYRSRAQITGSFVIDGVAGDPTPDTATVRIVRADSTELLAGNADEAGAGKYAKTLEPAQTTPLDQLTADWTAGDQQITTTYHEIVGGFLFTVRDAEARLPDLDAAAHRAGRTLAEEALEDACGVAFVPRYALDTYDGNGRTLLRPRRRHVRKVRSVTVDGVAYTPEQLAEVKISETGRLYSPAGWPTGYGNIVIGYEHGYDFPPARAGNAALLLLERWRADQPTGERVVAGSIDRVSFRLAVAGKDGEVFDVPEANAIVAMYGGSATRMH